MLNYHKFDNCIVFINYIFPANRGCNSLTLHGVYVSPVYTTGNQELVLLKLLRLY